MTVMQSKLEEIIEPAVLALGYELVGMEYFPRQGGALLRIYIDSENGVNLDACQAVSRQVGAVLDVEDPIKGRFNLEVSSPGLERPLFKIAHFQRFLGRKVKLRLRNAREDRKNFIGVINAVTDDAVTLGLEEDQTMVIEFNDIDKARLVADI